jgi:hypothetical protein
MRIFAALLATLCLILGFLMAHRYEAQFGDTLFIAGAIIIVAFLISSALLSQQDTLTKGGTVCPNP